MTRDPVCGMPIDPARAAATATHQGKTYYFCTPVCQALFTKAPEQYPPGSDKAPGTARPGRYGC